MSERVPRHELLPVLPADASAGDVAVALDEVGGVIIDRLVDPAVMDAVVADMEPWFAASAMGESDFEGHSTRRTGSVPTRSTTYRSIAMHPSVMAAGDHVLGHASTWCLSAVEMIEIFPGETGQRLHRDNWKYDYVALPVEVELDAMWALTDFTEDNGATVVVPGSHRWEHRRKPADEPRAAAVMAKGSLLLYRGQTFHGGGPNRSDDVRRGLSLQHAVGWVTRSEALYLECTPDVVRDWPDDLIRFVGYQRMADALNYFRDSEDPLAAVHPDRVHDRGWVVKPSS